jgi:hypothetical protein
MHAVARLHGPTTEFNESGKLASVSTARLCCFGMVQLLRLTVAAPLCYGGSYFIAHTFALGDLILSCIALKVRPDARPLR